MLFCLGFGVGGNMPTDGALYLEFLPREYHYLLTFMSVFFSLGAVLASVLGFLILPYSSCPETLADGLLPSCDVATQNNGWRIMLFSVAVATLIMLLVRTLCLKLPETPKFLMSQDRTRETIIVLEDIARINGEEIRFRSVDLPSRAQLTADSEEDRVENSGIPADQVPMLVGDTAGTKDMDDNLPWGGNRSLDLLFSPRWRRTTLLVWNIWTFTSMAFTMFNVFLPKYLETLGFEGESTPTRKDVYWDYMIYSVAGVPGSVMASYLIETRIGRKGTMAASALGSSAALFIFSVISSRATMLVSSSLVSFLVTLLYAVVYGYTPEVFDTAVRGTAVGTASGLGRIAGIVSPIVSGILFTINASLPLYVSVIGFFIVGICVVLLPFETRCRRQV
ncbi:hypothetical protein EC973_000601 [Apophysomyces ossiformis]|uniref:Major facilitator superfamily (MFS) profile domain-containing protein n=1 Tax=Apophysomyces ossiformis TaxID=679940 RepID=A0A8H7BQ73_9FUNG|nr:hypothetical protein EC973_000601 [Apophysomyces ossiformis]